MSSEPELHADLENPRILRPQNLAEIRRRRRRIVAIHVVDRVERLAARLDPYRSVSRRSREREVEVDAARTVNQVPAEIAERAGRILGERRGI